MPAQNTNAAPVVIYAIREPRKASKVGRRTLALLADYARVIVVGADGKDHTDALTEQYATDETIVIVSDVTALSTRTNVTNAAKRFERKLTVQALEASDTDGDVRIVAYVFSPAS